MSLIINSKRLIILLSIVVPIVIANTKIYAQDNSKDIYKNAMTFGIAHSFNFTSIVGSFPDVFASNISQTTNMTAPRFTLDFGMTTDYYISEQFSIQFDAVFTYNGAHFVSTRSVYNEIGIIETNQWFTYAMNYFKFPLAVSFYPKDKLYLTAGGYFATLLHSRKYEYWYNLDSKPINRINNIDYGMVFGMGFNLPYLKVGFQYSYGFDSFISDPNYDLHHSVFQVVARWKFYSDIRNSKRNI